MAAFDVTVRTLDEVAPHPNADRLELARVGGFHTVVAKGQFRAGDLIAYIPESAILPCDLLEAMNLTGKLAGQDFNRVKAVMLRGMLSQGLVLPAREGWQVGQSVMEELGVSKFDPGVPPGAEGERYALDQEEYVAFDIENIKAFPHLIAEGEDVVMSEKVHGVFMAVGARAVADSSKPHYRGRAFVSSKGVLSDRNAFLIDPIKADGEPGEENLYVRLAKRIGLFDKAIALSEHFHANVFILGEAFGPGVQDLGYAGTAGTPSFRAFAVAVLAASDSEAPGGWHWLGDRELDEALEKVALTRVPVIYRGPFSTQALEEATNGREQVSGGQAHLREGVVVVPAVERTSAELATFRVALKSVSAAYLSRKGGTEYS